MIRVSSKQKCEWDFCQTLTFKCPSDRTTGLRVEYSATEMRREHLRNLFSIITSRSVSTSHCSSDVLFNFVAMIPKPQRLQFRRPAVKMTSCLTPPKGKTPTSPTLFATTLPHGRHRERPKTQQQMTSQPLNTLSFSDLGVIWHFLPSLSLLMRQSL